MLRPTAPIKQRQKCIITTVRTVSSRHSTAATALSGVVRSADHQLTTIKTIHFYTNGPSLKRPVTSKNEIVFYWTIKISIKELATYRVQRTTQYLCHERNEQICILCLAIAIESTSRQLGALNADGYSLMQSWRYFVPASLHLCVIRAFMDRKGPWRLSLEQHPQRAQSNSYRLCFGSESSGPIPRRYLANRITSVHINW